MSSRVWPSEGSGSGGSAFWGDAVSNAAGLPASGTVTGELRQTLDTEDVWRWSGSAWEIYLTPSTIAEVPVDLVNDTSNVLPITKGGTNSSTALANGKVMVSSGGKIVEDTITQSQLQALGLQGSANGLATLDAGGKIPISQLPPVTITDTFVVASQAAQTALTVEVGDVCVRTDLNKSFILRALPPSIFSNWQELLTPTDSVLSVNGQTGAVSLSKSDVGLGSVDNTADASKPVSTAQAVAIAVVQSDVDTHEADVGNPHAVTKTQVGLGNVDNTSDATKNSAIAILTHKDIDGGTASDASRFTAPKETTTNLAALTRKQGTVVYDTTKNQLQADDGSILRAIGGLSRAVSKTANYTAVHGEMVECNTAAGGFTVTLPPGTSAFAIAVMDIGGVAQTSGKEIVVAPATGQTIDSGAANDTVTIDVNFASVTLYREEGSTAVRMQRGSLTLYSPGSVPGYTGGSAIAAGNIGEKVTTTTPATTLSVSGTSYNVNSMSIGPGVWMVYGKVGLGPAGTTHTQFVVSVSEISATLDNSATVADNSTGTVMTRLVASNPLYVDSGTVGKTVYLVVNSTFTGTAPVTNASVSSFYAVRIA